MSELGESVRPHGFRIEELVPVEKGVVAAARKAIVLVYDRHIKEPTVFHLVFGRDIIHGPSGKHTDWFATYDSSDSFLFGMDWIRKGKPTDVPLEAFVALLAAHEAVHKVQVYRRGGWPFGSEASPVTEEEYGRYFKDKGGLEGQAWTEAMHVAKKIFPHVRFERTSRGRVLQRTPKRTFY